MKEEIAAGIRNAMERGSSLEEVVNSFIQAGYNPDEVHEASQMVTGGVTQIIAPQSSAPESSALPSLESPAVPLKTEKKASRWKIIAIIVLLILIGIGLILMIFKEQIISHLR